MASPAIADTLVNWNLLKSANLRPAIASQKKILKTDDQIFPFFTLFRDRGLETVTKGRSDSIRLSGGGI